MSGWFADRCNSGLQHSSTCNAQVKDTPGVVETYSSPGVYTLHAYTVDMYIVTIQVYIAKSFPLHGQLYIISHII